jgi:hypothetical protein
VEASMDARISAGDQQAAGRVAALEQELAALRAEMPSVGAFQQAVVENLQRHAEEVGALDRKLAVLQDELPPKIKAIVDAVRESLDARMGVELHGMEDRHSARVRQTEARFSEAQEQFRQQVADASRTPELQQSVAKFQADLAAMQTTMDARLETTGRQVADRLAGLEQHAAQVTAGMAGELEALQVQQSTRMEQLEDRLRAEHPAQIDSAVAGLREALEAKVAAEIHELEARTPDRSPELEKAVQYASVLEARVQALEQKLQRSAEETVERAVERVWQALETRLQQREAHAVQAVETISGLRQKSSSAEQSVLDLIAGIGQLFEKPAAQVARGTSPTVAQLHAVAEPVAAPPLAAAHSEAVPAENLDAEPTVAAHPAPEPVVAEPAEPAAVGAADAPAPEPQPEAHSEGNAEAHVEDDAEAEAVQARGTPVIVISEPSKEVPEVHAETEPTAQPEPAVAPTTSVISGEDAVEPPTEEKPPVILFRPKDSGRKWRIPFVSSFLLMAVTVSWLQAWLQSGPQTM